MLWKSGDRLGPGRGWDQIGGAVAPRAAQAESVTPTKAALPPEIRPLVTPHRRGSRPAREGSPGREGRREGRKRWQQRVTSSIRKLLSPEGWMRLRGQRLQSSLVKELKSMSEVCVL